METKIIDLPMITVIGKEGLCTAEKNIAQQLWQEANSHFNEVAVPEGWTKWVMPARKYIVVDVEADRYGEIFDEVINNTLSEKRMKLAGAVCDYTEPATGKNKLFFPVASL